MSTGTKEITVIGVSRRLDEFYIVDVREPAEYTGELGHIAGSQLLPLGELHERLGSGATPEELFADRGDRLLLMVCRSGGRSGKACERLAEAGFADAINMLGGMLEWNREVLPTARVAPAPPDGQRD